MFNSKIALLLTFAITSCLFTIVSALPLRNIQTVFYKEKATVPNNQDWFMSQEYDIFSSITDYYENMVDSTLSSESEELLLNLIYLPESTKHNLLQSQAKYLGIESLSDKQLKKMPSIIGKHIQAMNTKVYDSIENIITLYWHTIWNQNLLTKADTEDQILQFLSSFNGIVAKNLMDEIEEYDLLKQIKSDILNQQEEQQQQEYELISILDWFKKMFFVTAKPSILFEFENDFLRQHLTDTRTSLLMELHIQFIDFYTRIQTDIIEQLSAYYNE